MSNDFEEIKIRMFQPDPDPALPKPDPVSDQNTRRIRNQTLIPDNELKKRQKKVLN